MKDELTEQQTLAILKALEEAIETGPWEESNFLRVIGKNLREIRDDFVEQLGGSQGADKVKAESIDRAEPPPGRQEVFIALYSSEGNNLQAWERILQNLPRQIISRPIYAEEEAVKSLIKSKENKINEAYVGIFINQTDVLSVAQDKIPLDKFGKPLLSLKDRTLNLEYVTRFVHYSGIYSYVRGRLIKKD